MSCEIPYEDLAACLVNELAPDRRCEVEGHVQTCDRCRRRLDALRHADSALFALPKCRPSTEAVLAARRALADELRPGATPAIMTLDEVAEFLRVSPDDLVDLAGELPAFEIGGNIRVRRERLLEWIHRRERDYTRQVAESWVAQAAGEQTTGALQ